MENIKTIPLDGTEIKAEGMGGQNTIVRNLGDTTIYASASPGVTADADGVAEIPAGGALNIYGTRGTIYLKGVGKAQLTGTDYADLNCVSAAVSGGGSSGGSSGNVITKEEIDSLFK